MATLYFGNTLINQSEANVATVVESLTKAEYDALAVKDPNTLYVLTDVEDVNTVFVAEYGVTTIAELESAYNAGRLILVEKDTQIGYLVKRVGGSIPTYTFAAPGGEFDGEGGSGSSPSIMMLCIKDMWRFGDMMHGSDHASDGYDPITPDMIGAAPAYTYGTTDLTAGTSELAEGTLYFVYE